MDNNKCAVEYCDKPSHTRGWCQTHYKRWTVHGSPLVNKKVKHGLGNNANNIPEYRAWHSMKDRCSRENHKQYRHYGGRGIAVCDRWNESYENFLNDMGERPSDDHSLDRIDNNGNYTPDNCRWATKSQQNKNRRKFSDEWYIKHNAAYRIKGA